MQDHRSFHRSRIIPNALIVLMAFLSLSGCRSDPTPAALATTSPPPTATATLTAAVPPTRTSTPVPTPSHTPTASPTPTPTPMPGGGLIAFETYRDGNGEVYLLDIVTDQLLNLTRHSADDRAPAWHPDGRAIAFESHRDGNWELYVLDLSDGSIARLTDNPDYDGSPSWSPDGTRIAFESYRDGNLEIYTLALDTAQILRLTDNPDGDYGPQWSPDGQWIAFTSWRDGNKEIYVVPSGGGEAQNLTQSVSDEEDAVWAPDGATLAFVSWQDVDGQSGSRNAEIYRMVLATGMRERMTDNPWPDRDPAWDAEAGLLWAAYDPGAPFETYDPFRPGSYHLYRSSPEGPQRLTDTDRDDGHPDPVPKEIASLNHLPENLPPEPVASTSKPTLEVGALAQIVEVSSVLVGYTGQPIQVNELVAPSLVSWQQDVLEASGWDLLEKTLGSWRNIDQVRKKELYRYDYGYLSWHKAGRALDLALEYKVDGVNQMVLTREDLGAQIYWRMYLRTAKQDGSQGEPLKENPWLHWWHIVPEHEPEAYAAGGKRLPIPSGYYADITGLARRHGWERIACYAIEGDYHWNTDSNGTEYWHYERTDGLIWWDAMLQIYPVETLEEHVGWEQGLNKAQSEAMMRSKGIATPRP